MFIPPVLYPFFIKSYTLYRQLNTSVAHFVEKLAAAYDVFFTHTEYAFYEGYFQPVLYKRNNSNVQPTLLFDADKMIFYPNIILNSACDKYYTLPILSLEVIDSNDNVLHDLTDFIEKIKFIKVHKCPNPSLSSVSMIWATLTNIYLSPSKHKLRYIDSMGDLYEKELTDTAELENSQ